jgi:enoyl-[acyl-carrier protein] reductase I
MFLDGKKLLITGVTTRESIAFHVARQAQTAGAEILLTGFGKGLRLTRLAADSLAAPCDVLELDVTREEQVATAVEQVRARWDRVDGVVHAIAFAPAGALDGGFLTASWEEVNTALHVSTYSYVSLARAFGPLLAEAGGGSVVGLDFDASQVWAGYDWMGVAKAGLEGCNRYLAAALGSQGTRVNLVAAGPLRTLAAGAIQSFPALTDAWCERAPLGWDPADPTPVARTVCALLSDWLPQVTGEIVHVDGGVHVVAVAKAGDR